MTGLSGMPDLSLNEKKALLKIARFAIEKRLQKESSVDVKDTNKFSADTKAGCFVTLRVGKRLRGCIGTFNSEKLLIDEIKRMAAAAAFEDPRFTPLRPDELKSLTIEISVLGELKKINHIEEIQIGRHGVLVKFELKSGTYLPDVAAEQGWDAEKFVNHCAVHKAGIAPEDVAKAEIFVYDVIKFSDEKDAAA